MASKRSEPVSFYDTDLKDDGQVLAFIEHAQDLRRKVGRERELNAIHNILWYAGHQDINRFNGGQLARLKNPYGRVRLIFNQIMPQVEAQIARMGFEPIHYEVLPDGDGTDAFRTASLRSAVLRHYAEEMMDFATLDETVNRWAAIAGDGIVKVVWDPYAGDDIDVLEDLGMSASEFRSTFRADPELTMGDLCVHVVQGFNLFWGPVGAELEDAEWVVEINERSRSYLKERYDLDDEVVEQLKSGDEHFIHRIGDITGTGDRTMYSADPDAVIVAELWVRRCKRVPKGRHAVVAGGKVVRNKENPYAHGRHPYVRIKFLPVPAHEHGLPLVTNLRGPQSDINKNMSQQVEVRELSANPRIWARGNAIVNEDEINSRPGGIATYRGERPITEPGQAMPAVTLVALQRTLSFMQDVSGSHDISQSKVPAGAKSGIALRTLKEGDEERLGPFTRRRRRFWEHVGELMLLTLEQYAEEDRYVQILGPEHEWEVRLFNRAALRGEGGTPGLRRYRVRVRTTGLPKSRAAQTELVNGLLERGVFALPPEDKRLVFEMLDIGDIGQQIDPKRRERQRAKRENEQLAGGEQVEVLFFDDDETHQLEHVDYMRSEQYRKLAGQSQLNFQIHYTAHDRNKARRAFMAQKIVSEVGAEMGFGPPPSAPGPVGGNGMAGQAPVASAGGRLV